MLEKKMLRMNSVLALEHEDVKAYADQIAAGNYPDELPKTHRFDLMKKELKDNVVITDSGSVVIYGFYNVTENDYLVLSRLGISVLTREELNAVTME